MTFSPSVESILNAIMRADPDGGETEPTEAAYAAHKQWAVSTFGADMWEMYRRGGWNEPSDEPRHVEY